MAITEAQLDDLTYDTSQLLATLDSMVRVTRGAVSSAGDLHIAVIQLRLLSYAFANRLDREPVHASN